MGKGAIISLGITVIVILLLMVFGGQAIGIFNRFATLRAAFDNKQIDNTSEHDNMWKKISQVAQVTDAQKEAIKDIMVGYAQARSQGRDGSGSFVNAVREVVPNMDTTTFNNLQNVIVGSRDSFTMRQKELLDIKREHDTLRTTFPGNFVAVIFKVEELKAKIVTSTKTEKAFETGKDDDVSVFSNKKPVEVEKSK